MKYAESKVRQLCNERELDWDAMTEDKRLNLINDIVHENFEDNR